MEISACGTGRGWWAAEVTPLGCYFKGGKKRWGTAQPGLFTFRPLPPTPRQVQYILNSDPLWCLWQENNAFLPESIREMALEVEGRGARSICFRRPWVFSKPNFHLPLSCFDLDLQEDTSPPLGAARHSVIIPYTMKDNLCGELHFSRPPPPPRSFQGHYLANPRVCVCIYIYLLSVYIYKRE